MLRCLRCRAHDACRASSPTPTTPPFPPCAPCRISGLQSGVYSLLTPVLALAGASYLFAPGMTLAQVFGFAKGVEGFFLWQVGHAAWRGKKARRGSRRLQLRVAMEAGRHHD